MEAAIASGQSVIEKNFYELMMKLLKALRTVFADCDKVKQAKFLWKRCRHDPDAIRQIMRAAFDDLSPHLELILDRDAETLLDLDIQFFTKIDMKPKWNDPEFAQSHERMWEYIDTLVTYLRMRFEVSQAMIAAIEGVAEQLGADIKNGVSSAEKLDLKEIGEKVVKRMQEGADGKMTEAELQKQAMSLMTILCDNPVYDKVLQQVFKKNGIAR